MNATASKDKLLDDLQAVVRDAEALLQATATQSGEKLDSIRARTAESLEQARERITVLEREAVAELRHAAEAADDYVRDNPWAAIGVAAGAGLFIGLLLSRR